jgi:hypothetical protein
VTLLPVVVDSESGVKRAEISVRISQARGEKWPLSGESGRVR